MRALFWRKQEEKKETLGEKGERIAAKYLSKKGYKVLETNFKNPFGKRLGEIDIIVRQGKEIIFVEVKTRVKTSYDDVLPEESITPSKLRKLCKIANFYIKTRNLFDTPYRFDAVSVRISENGETAEVKHIESIFY